MPRSRQRRTADAEHARCRVNAVCTAASTAASESSPWPGNAGMPCTGGDTRATANASATARRTGTPPAAIAQRSVAQASSACSASSLAILAITARTAGSSARSWISLASQAATVSPTQPSCTVHTASSCSVLAMGAVLPSGIGPGPIARCG